jgi:hypothetical protein
MQDSVIYIKIITSEPRKDFFIYGKLIQINPLMYDMSYRFPSGYSNLNINGGTSSGGSGYYTTIDSLPATITITSFSGNRALGA